MLQELMEQHGKRAWSDVAREFPDRTGKQGRERWINHQEFKTQKLRYFFVLLLGPLGLIYYFLG
ncbi:SANT/Myb-like DNA-binding domain-containing protein, partial [Klebsiella pneumoniae]|uniref:SANT/Myb-like DNA-binding domain-containing protein n=1 Tax=Klebsiella pneumoniae TaxID=573 RepID=UPI0034DE361C